MNPLFKKEIDIDIQEIKDFDFQNLVSWSQIEIQMALRGKKADYDTFKFYVYGTLFDQRLYNMIIHSIQSTSMVDKYLDKIETIEMIYQMTSNSMSDIKIVKKWIAFAQNKDKEKMMDVPYKILPDHSKNSYKMLAEIDKKFPLALLKFYNKYKRELSQYDTKFISFIDGLIKLKAKKDSSFKKFLDAFEKDLTKQRNLSMFIN